MDIKEYEIGTKGEKQNHPWEYARFEVVWDLLHPFLKKKEGCCILDIGCGDVFFLEQLRKQLPSAELYAVDKAFTEKELQLFSEKHLESGIRFYNEIPASEFTNKPIDVVFLLDVIEHIEEDLDFLRTLSSLTGITKDSLIVISVPAYQSLFCSHDKWLGHYRRYSLPSLKRQTQQAGLNTFSSGYFFTSLLLPRFLQKGIEVLFRSKEKKVEGIGNWEGGRISSALMKNLLIFDYQLSRMLRKVHIRLPGLSCYSICKKQP